MSLGSWALVHGASPRAGNAQRRLYLSGDGQLRHAGAAAGVRSAGRSRWRLRLRRDPRRHAAARRRGGRLVLALLGAGSKAGLVPLHVWLPLAHPAAPEPRLGADERRDDQGGGLRLHPHRVRPAGRVRTGWWGVVVLALGGITAVLGVLYALMQRDLKRLLAYSHRREHRHHLYRPRAGAGVSGQWHALPAALALTAALFHVLNHSLFKSLLFFGAGAVLTATGERDMERLGGLIHRMPATSIAFLIGAAAISALPPFNGFVSEWLTFQAVLQSPQLPQWRPEVPGAGGRRACWRWPPRWPPPASSRPIGVTFLGRPRSPAARRARRRSTASRSPRCAILALLCLLAGVVPGTGDGCAGAGQRRASAASACCRPAPTCRGCRSCRSVDCARLL
ncbi:MAG: hypothetical protein MZV49_26355 [Rhodopseudomonas palustris]|nr:hypothetical protein [Rhodopseudomonas palustris]